MFVVGLFCDCDAFPGVSVAAFLFVYLVVPHLTVGTLAYGGGTILEPRDCRCLRWRIACPPVFLEEFGGSPTWSRDELFVADVTALARTLSGSEWFLSRTLRPVPARVHFDFERRRFARLALLGST